MTQSPLVTLAAGVAGAMVGLIAPVIAASFTRLGATRQAQRDVADKILDLLSAPGRIDTLLGGPDSESRRQLFVLGLRLRDQPAREACMDLVAGAGAPGASENDLYPAWHRTLSRVSRVSRGERKDGPDAEPL